MITDNKCFQVSHKKQTLSSEILISSLLEDLLKENIINFATYQKAKEGIKSYDESTISK